jgi:hypothetical protein
MFYYICAPFGASSMEDRSPSNQNVQLFGLVFIRFVTYYSIIIFEYY